MNTLNKIRENFYHIRHNSMFISLTGKQVIQLHKFFGESKYLLNLKNFKSLISTSLVITFYDAGNSLCFFLENRADKLWYKIVYSHDLKQIFEFYDLEDFGLFMLKVCEIFKNMNSDSDDC